MTPKLKVKLVLQLRDQGLNRTEIASSRHISRKNVNEIFSIAQEKGLTYQSVKDRNHPITPHDPQIVIF